LERENQQVVN